MKPGKRLLLALLLGSHVGAACQTAPLRYWVQFTGKIEAPNYSFNLEEPIEFLSPRSIERRARQGIAFDETDLPVASSYIEAVNDLPGIQVVLSSKWMNAVTIRCADSTVTLDAIEALPFVSEIRSVSAWKGDGRPVEAITQRAEQASPSNYGAGWTALNQLNGQALHGLGYRGAGKWIAVLDAGFDAADRLPVFEKAFNEGRILLGIDAMQSQAGLFAHHRHGTSVLGTMAAWWPDSLIGTAPDATYVLYRTEDAYSEYLVEEDYWIRAAEHADSLGVDLMNTSLGYSLFDDTSMNHTWDDLDGSTTHIARGMSAAASKGILCVTSAGNSGNNAWHRITTPADAHGILAVGAVNSSGNHASFSGFGPSADGRIKPEVMALGLGAAYPTHDTLVKTGNGTSFASPILCGMAACLWESVPDATAEDIRWAIIASAHLNAMPNDSMGYGIPDFGLAKALLAPAPHASQGSMLVFPNPAANRIRIEIPNGVDGQATFNAYDLKGCICDSQSIPMWEGDAGATGWIDLQLAQGTYVIEVVTSDGSALREVLLIERR